MGVSHCSAKPLLLTTCHPLSSEYQCICPYLQSRCLEGHLKDAIPLSKTTAGHFIELCDRNFSAPGMPSRSMIAINKKACKLDRSPLVSTWQIFAENDIAFFFVHYSQLCHESSFTCQLNLYKPITNLVIQGLLKQTQFSLYYIKHLIKGQI